MIVNHLEIEREIAIKNVPSYLVKNTKTGRFIRLGVLETKYLLDTLNAIDMAIELELDSSKELPEELKKQLYDKFIEWKFLKDKDDDIKKKKRVVDLSRIKIVTFNVERLVNSIYPCYSKIFSKWGLLSLIAIIIATASLCIYFILGKPSEANNDISLIFSVKDIIITVILFIFSTAAHELGHAVVCKKYGGTVKTMGIMLFFIIPCFYCDVTDIYAIQNRKFRARVALAGIFSNILLSFFILLIALVLSLFDIIILPFYYFSMSCLWINIYNLIPLVKLDGYWFLSAISGVTNLMDKSFVASFTTFFARKNIEYIDIPSSKRRWLALYGVLAFLFKPCFWMYNLILVSRYFNSNMELIVIALGITLILTDLSKTILRYYKMIKNDYQRLLKMMS